MITLDIHKKVQLEITDEMLKALEKMLSLMGEDAIMDLCDKEQFLLILDMWSEIQLLTK